MTRFAKNHENRVATKGLYCVWVPLHNDGKAPLVSIWIDPTTAPLENCLSFSTGETIDVGEDALEEVEGPRRKVFRISDVRKLAA